MNLIFLGTSAATPTKDRNLPAIALRLNSGEMVLFDAGEDVQRRFEAAKLKFNTTTTIFISHMHGDHVIGLPGLLFNFHLNDRTAPLTIIGPQGLAAFLNAHYQYIGLKAQTYDLTIYEVEIPENVLKNYQENTPHLLETPEQIRLIEYKNLLTPQYERHFLSKADNCAWETPEYKVLITWTAHSTPTLGFRFEELPRAGKFDPNRAKAMDIPIGSIWKRMQEGKPVKLKDGREIDPIKEGIVTEKRPGYSIVYTADTGQNESIIKFSVGADILIAESTYAHADEELAIEKKHLTSKMAAQIAKDGGVKQLFLTHFSSRYSDSKILEAEAKEIFSNTFAAEELMVVELKPKP